MKYLKLLTFFLIAYSLYIDATLIFERIIILASGDFLLALALVILESIFKLLALTTVIKKDLFTSYLFLFIFIYHLISRFYIHKIALGFPMLFFVEIFWLLIPLSACLCLNKNGIKIYKYFQNHLKL